MSAIPHQFRPDEGFAQALDAADPLGSLRNEFAIPAGPDGAPLVYLLGNSLGLMPRSARAIIEEETENWERLAIDGHFAARVPWASYSEAINPALARVVGAEPDEVVAMNTLTVNLHLMLASFYQPDGRRRKVLMEDRAFPSDRFAVASHLALRGVDPSEAILVARPLAGEETLRTEDIEALLEEQGQEIALVMLAGVNYLTGQWFDLGRIAEAARRQGCKVGYDLAHAAGNVPLALHDWDVDFAVWCTYKYLNAGPGSIAGAFIHRRHGSDSSIPRLTGWWGQTMADRFAMGPTHHPAQGAAGWEVSNPPILSLAPLRASLEQFDRVGMPALRQKSEALTGYLAALLSAIPDPPFQLLTPGDPGARGCQLSVQLPGRGRELNDRLRAVGIVPDYREPDVVRFAPTPLYNTYTDVWRVGQAVRAVLTPPGA
ncbi:MAG: kynureninase [Gemmatimonadota bacterium]